jgi:hypothetical protein
MEIAYDTIQAFQKVITGDSLEGGDPIAPYRSGPELIEFFNQFGEDDEYGQGFPSRWYFAEEKLKKFNGTDQLEEILEGAVDPRHFLGSEYKVSDAVDFLNQFLTYDDLKIVRDGKFYKLYDIEEEVEETIEEVETAETSEVDGIIIFISHSSEDVEIAENLVELLRTALDLNSDQIRCTSVDGYRLPGGVTTNDQLKEEIYNSKSFIGLITPSSLESSYVLFELGARWGAKKQLIPLLAAGSDPSDLVGPLSDINALSCNNKSQMFQLISELSEFLNCNTEKVELYSKLIDDLVVSSNE